MRGFILIQKTCLRCGKIFDKGKYVSNKSWLKVKFCSKNCVKNKIIKSCLNCNKQFYVKFYRSGIAKFCCKKCSSDNRINKNFKIDYAIRRRQVYVDWRKSIFERDNYTCVFCGIKNKNGLGISVKLNADHIKPLKLIIMENNLDTIEKMMLCQELWDTRNGRTLCEKCHRKTETYGRRRIYKTCVASS